MAVLPPDPVFCLKSDMGYVHSLCFPNDNAQFTSRILAATEGGYVYVWNLEVCIAFVAYLKRFWLFYLRSVATKYSRLYLFHNICVLTKIWLLYFIDKPCYTQAKDGGIYTSSPLHRPQPVHTRKRGRRKAMAHAERYKLQLREVVLLRRRLLQNPPNRKQPRCASGRQLRRSDRHKHPRVHSEVHIQQNETRQRNVFTKGRTKRQCLRPGRFRDRRRYPMGFYFRENLQSRETTRVHHILGLRRCDR